MPQTETVTEFCDRTTVVSKDFYYSLPPHFRKQEKGGERRIYIIRDGVAVWEYVRLGQSKNIRLRLQDM
jgi:hypothetical protein